jgi:hypothetical protein
LPIPPGLSGISGRLSGYAEIGVFRGSQYAVAPTNELKNDIEPAGIELEEFNKEPEKIPLEKLAETAGYFSQITGAPGNPDGEIGEVFSSMSDSFGCISESMKNDTSTMAGKMNAYATAIEGVVSPVNLAASAAKRRDAAEKEFYKNQIALAHEYALAVNEQIRTQSEITGSGFLRDYAGEIEDGFNALTDATGKYREALGKLNEGKAKIDLRNSADWGETLKATGTGAAVGAAIGSMILPGIGTAIGTAAGAIGGFLVGVFGTKKKTNVTDEQPAVFPGTGRRCGEP